MDYSVTFESADAYAGMGICTGSLRFSPKSATLHLEWQVKDGVFGVVKSGLKSRSLPTSDISSTTYKPGLIGGKIILQGHSMSVFADVPGADGNCLRLDIPRRARAHAKTLNAELKLHLSELELNEAAANTNLPT